MSGLKVGQRIASINEYDVEDNVQLAIQLIQECEGKLTIQAYQEILEEDLEVVNWENEYERIRAKHNELKVIVFASLLIIIIAGILLCSAG